MLDVLGRYGFRPNRAGFIQCPFHTGDRQPSMKIYKKDFHCFACGVNGDVFSFVQRMEQVNFKEAFRILGGTYEKPSFASDLAIYRSEARKRMEEKRKQKEKARMDANNALIEMYRTWMKKSEPFSDAWCECCNELQRQLYIHEILYEKR